MTVKEVAAKIVDGVHFMSLWWKILSVIYEIFNWLDNSSYSSSPCTCMTDPKISFFWYVLCHSHNNNKWGKDLWTWQFSHVIFMNPSASNFFFVVVMQKDLQNKSSWLGASVCKFFLLFLLIPNLIKKFIFFVIILFDDFMVEYET